jgi:purine-cytosine permease-like protein
MHLRMPSIDKGVQSFVWTVVFFLYIFFGMKAIGIDGATSLIVALVSGFLIFLFVRTRDDVRE